MKQCDIMFPGDAHRLAYKGSSVVIQIGLDIALGHSLDQGCERTLTFGAINSRGAVTKDLFLAVPATSMTLEAIIQALQKFKKYVDDGADLDNHEKEVIEVNERGEYDGFKYLIKILDEPYKLE